MTHVAFDADTTEALMGTSKGFMLSWDLEKNEIQGNAFCASEEFNYPITSLQRFVAIPPPENLYLVGVNKHEVYIYSETRRDLKPVLLSEDDVENDKLMEMTIVQSQIAYNSKFFILGFHTEEK